GAGEPTASNVQAAARAPLVLIATPDREVVPVARELARARLPWTGRIVAHCSGAVSSATLEPLRRRGAPAASIHPLASTGASLPLMGGASENVPRLAPLQALAVPISRGDIATLRFHSDALRTLPADLRRLHRILALRSSGLALQARTITPEMAGRIARLLSTL